MPRREAGWSGVGWDALMLGLEASTVIALRTMKIAAGGAQSHTEARRMVHEKAIALAEIQRIALTGGLGKTAVSASRRVIGHYRRKVRANRRRLNGS